MRVLVIGGGIAGLTAATRLSVTGHDVCLMEREKKLRTEGYMIDFFGPGFDVAERMGLLPALEQAHYPVGHLLFINEKAEPRADVDYPRIRKTVFHDRHFNFMRGDLERVLFEQLPREVEVRFGAEPRSITQDGDQVTVEDGGGRRDRYDLVVGADGAHSGTRELVMRADEVSERYLGCHTAAYILPGVPPQLPPDALVTLAETDIDVGAYPIRGGRTATFFLHRVSERIGDHAPEACRRELDAAFRGRGWIIDRLLDAFPEDGPVYYDDVTQIEAARWARGRVVLVGDACGAVSLVAGQGASMAMAGAYVLAEELSSSEGDLPAALARYEERIRPPVESRQRRARRNLGWFLPRSHVRALLRDWATDWFMKSPFTSLLSRRLGADSIDLS